MNRHLRPPRTLVTWIGGVILLVTAVNAHAAQKAGQVGDPALVEFEQRLEDYLALRGALSQKLKPMAPTASASEIASRRTMLAQALRAARLMAKPGDLMPPPIAAVIRALVLEDFKRRAASEERAVFSEVPNATQPAINRTYPADAALPTVPPLLLLRLPRLPENLQYRFYGRHVVLLDSDAEIILDYIANVLPPH
jgi:hypothetical protein